MVEGLRGLVQLSHLDAEIRVRVEEKEGLPAQRAACAKRRADQAAHLSSARAQLEEIRQEQRRHETVAQDQEALLARLEGQQHQVKTNDAYTALLHEMDAARLAISVAETAVLEAMEGLDRGEAELQDAESAGQAEVADVEAEEAALGVREQELDGQIVALSSERDGVAAGIEASLLSRYERVASRRRPAIAVVSSETCTGCRVGVPPQSYLELCNGEKLVSCDQCHRILVHQAHLA